MMKLSLVVPCYNEAENVSVFAQKARENLADIDYEIVFINDGSKDDTFKELKKIKEQKKESITIVNFSRNFGKEAGIYAGFQHAKGEYVTIIDADLQQPLEVAREMYDFLEEHAEYDAVAAYQEERKEGRILSAFKSAFYNVINKLCDIELYKNASDFRCMRRNVVEAILSMSEYHRFSKGIFGWIGFKTYWLSYENVERVAGKSKWSFWKLMKYSFEGIFNFSDAPLKFASWTGFFFMFVSLIMTLVVFIRTLVFGDPVSGWPSLVCIILFVGGVQLFCLGVIGQYISKIYKETKHRPQYIVAQTNKEDIVKK